MITDDRERLTLLRMARVRNQVDQWGACFALNQVLSTLFWPPGSEEARDNLISNIGRYEDLDIGAHMGKVAILIFTLVDQIKERDKAAEKQKAATDHDITHLQELVKTQAGYMKHYQEHIAFLESEANLRGATQAQLAADYKAMREGSPAAGSPTDGGTAAPEPTPSEPDATPIDPAGFGGEDYFGRLQ